MTSQTKYFIELSDIVSLCFKCGNEKCGAILTLPLPLTRNVEEDHALAKCPVCKRSWAVLDGGPGGVNVSYEPLIKEFVDGINKVSGARFGFSLRMELKEEPRKKEAL